MACWPDGRCCCGKAGRNYKWIRLPGLIYAIYKIVRDLLDL